MSEKNMLGLAIALAAVGHQEQEDKGGKAYILHPIRVMQNLYTDDEELMQGAILHDYVEDVLIPKYLAKGMSFLEALEASLNELREQGFSERVVEMINGLTHRKGEKYSDYLIRAKLNDDSRRIKRRDIRDNSDIDRLKGLREKDFLRMQKYQIASMFLKDKITLDEMKSLMKEAGVEK